MNYNGTDRYQGQNVATLSSTGFILEIGQRGSSPFCNFRGPLFQERASNKEGPLKGILHGSDSPDTLEHHFAVGDFAIILEHMGN